MVEFRECKSRQPDKTISREIWDAYYDSGADLDFLHEVQELIEACVQNESIGRMDMMREFIGERLKEVNLLVDRASEDGATVAAIYIDTCGRREDLTLKLEICDEAIAKLEELFKSDAYWSALGDEEDDLADDFEEDDDDFDGDEEEDEDDEDDDEEETYSPLVLEARRQARERIELMSAVGFFGAEEDDAENDTDDAIPLPMSRWVH